ELCAARGAAEEAQLQQQQEEEEEEEEEEEKAARRYDPGPAQVCRAPGSGPRHSSTSLRLSAPAAGSGTGRVEEDGRKGVTEERSGMRFKIKASLAARLTHATFGSGSTDGEVLGGKLFDQNARLTDFPFRTSKSFPSLTWET
ncbi:Monocarboxylate transporter 1, partial [Frankliniella fusca]